MRRDETPMEHLDEGTAHAWLDGALPAEQAARVAAHVAACPACSAVVAEARGLIAGASRIVGALDVVPGGVVPEPAAVAPSPRRPRRWALRAAAAIAVMVGGTTLVMRSASRPRYAAADSAVFAPASRAPGPSAPAMDVATTPPAPAPVPSPAPEREPALARAVPERPPASREERRALSAAPTLRSEMREAAKIASVNAAPPAVHDSAPGAAAAGAAAPLPRADVAARTGDVAVGCYALDGVPAGWPTSLELRAPPLPSGAPGGHAARAASADSAYWVALPGDSVRVVWFVRAAGVEARLGRSADGTLRGTARPLGTGDAAPRAVVARRSTCTDR